MTHKLETPTASKFDALARQRNEDLHKVYHKVIEHEAVVEHATHLLYPLEVLKMAKATGGESATMWIQFNGVLKVNVSHLERHLFGEKGKAVVKELAAAGMGTTPEEHAAVLANWILEDNPNYAPDTTHQRMHDAIIGLLARIGLEVEECRQANVIGIVPRT